MRNTVRLAPPAQRYFERATDNTKRRIAARLEQIRADPLDIEASKPLHGRLGQLRSSRVGDLRIVFEVREAVLLVYVVRIGPRGDVYGA